MEYDPPIKKRTTGQLLDIVETEEQWKPDVVEMAQQELVRRGISIDKQKERQKKRKTRETSFLKRTLFIKANATYSTREKILIVLFWPFLTFLLSEREIFYPGEGYKKKNKQGLFLFGVGLLVWGLLLYCYLMYFE